MTYYIHDIPGRLRSRAVLRFNYSAEKKIAALLKALTGVKSVAFNGTTGSCLIYYDRSMTCRDDIVSVLSGNGYFNPPEAKVFIEEVPMQPCKVGRLAGYMSFLALILPFMAHAAGTPQITSLSGALTNGNTITVNGGNFIQMNMANWIPFFQNNPTASNFGGASPEADGYSTQGPQGGVYDTSFYLMGTQSMRFDVSGDSTTCPQDNLFSYNAILSGGGDAQDLWIRAYVAYNSADGLWFANQDKMFMCEGYGPGQYAYEPANWATLPSQMEADFDGMSHRANIPSGPIQNMRWYCMEVHWQTVAAPYVYQAWIDGVELSMTIL